MNVSAKNPALETAFNRARDFNGPSSYTINKRELATVLKAGAGCDGKFSKDEAIATAYKLLGFYSNFTPAATKDLNKFLTEQGIRDLNDVFTS
jgi:hypothetical protein